MITTTETALSHKELLTIIKNGIDQQGFFRTQWEQENDTPILYASTSPRMFEQFYKIAFPFLDNIMALSHQLNIDIDTFFSSIPPPNPSDPNYIVLKYETNDKAPIRENFRYYIWFAQKCHDYINYEEVDDGFIRFFSRKEDFIQDNMVRSNKAGFLNWLQFKNAHLPSEILEKILPWFPD